MNAMPCAATEDFDRHSRELDRADARDRWIERRAAELEREYAVDYELISEWIGDAFAYTEPRAYLGSDGALKRSAGTSEGKLPIATLLAGDYIELGAELSKVIAHRAADAARDKAETEFDLGEQL